MDAARLEPPRAHVPLQAVGCLSDLNAILDDAVDGVMLKRRVPLAVQSALDSMPLEPVMGERLCLPSDHVADAVRHLFAEWGLGDGEAKEWLAEDVQALAMHFAQILSITNVTLRFEVIHDDACRRFHRDAIRARLICTYRGAGTEFGVAEPGDEPDIVETAPTGCPIILKGKAWPGSKAPTLVHRSPPIEGTGMLRLVVVIDEVLPDFI